MMDVECWMVDSLRIQNCSFKISQPVRSVRFQEIMGCFNFGFWMMDFGFIQNSELTGLAGLGQEEIRSSVFSFQFEQRGSQNLLECGIKRFERLFLCA